MAQKIVTMCDAHLHTEEAEVPGLAWEVTLLGPGESKPTTWAVDLCHADGKTLEDLAVMLTAVGRITEGSKKARREAARAAMARESSPTAGTAHAAPTAALGVNAARSCPVEGCGAVAKNRQALASHLRSAHDGMSLAKAYGQPEPYACPDCDFSSARPQGLGAHRRAAHGTPSASVAAGASEAG